MLRAKSQPSVCHWPSVDQAGRLRLPSRLQGPFLGLESSFINGGATRAENPTQLESTQRFFGERETQMGEGPVGRGPGGGAARPLAALLRRPRHIGPSCDSLELPAPSHAARPLARSGAAAIGRSGHWQRGRSGRLPSRRPLALQSLIAVRFYPAGQSNLARLLARRPWTPRAFRARAM